MARLIAFLFFCFFVWAVPTFGQTDYSCYAVKVLKNGKEFKERKYMNTFSKKGFYIYRNFFYNLEFTDSVKTFGRIIDIKNDSIYITTSFNSATAKLRSITFDTLKYSIKQIKTLRLITDEIYGYTRDIALKDYTLLLIKEPCCNKTSAVSYRKELQDYIQTDTIFNKKQMLVTTTKFKNKKGDEIITDCYPYLTNNGIAFIYEKDGLIWTVGSLKDGK